MTTTKEPQEHQPGCKINLQCLVDHHGKPCPGPYGTCTCKEPQEKDWSKGLQKEQDFDTVSYVAQQKQDTIEISKKDEAIWKDLETLWEKLDGPKWAKQGRNEEQVYGVENFLTGLGGMAVLALIASAERKGEVAGLEWVLKNWVIKGGLHPAIKAHLASLKEEKPQ